MTAHPIDTEALAKRAGHILFTEGPEQPAATARETCVLLDLLTAAEHRATRAEAERDASRKQYDEDIAYWIAATDAAEARIKAVRDIHAPEECSSWDGDGAICQECLYSDESSVEYPCPTIRALDS